jgi:hypothetical protein
MARVGRGARRMRPARERVRGCWAGEEVVVVGERRAWRKVVGGGGAWAGSMLVLTSMKEYLDMVFGVFGSDSHLVLGDG